MRAKVLAVVVIALLVAACGGRSAPKQTQEVSENTADAHGTLATETAFSTPEASPSTDGLASPSEDEDGAPPSESDGPPPSPPPLEVSVTVANRCVSPGSPQIITIHSVPDAGISMVIGYADHDTHGHRAAAFTDERGEYVWRVVLPHDVGTGSARVLVSAVGPEPEPGQELAGAGSAYADFEVRQVGGCTLAD